MNNYSFIIFSVLVCASLAYGFPDEGLYKGLLDQGYKPIELKYQSTRMYENPARLVLEDRNTGAEIVIHQKSHTNVLVKIGEASQLLETSWIASTTAAISDLNQDGAPDVLLKFNGGGNGLMSVWNQAQILLSSPSGYKVIVRENYDNWPTLLFSKDNTNYFAQLFYEPGEGNVYPDGYIKELIALQ